MRKLLLPTLLTFFIAGLWAQNAPEKKIQALIITGQNGHKWRETTPFLRDRLEETGRFEVRVVEEFRGAGPETLAPYDVVILNYSDWRKKSGLRWGDRTEQAFLDYVRSGKGLVVYHFAASAFEAWPEYDKVIGGAWREKSGHSKSHDFKVDIKDREHPITKGLPSSFAHSDELYATLVWQPNVHILATAYDDPSLAKGSGKDQTMLWTLPYGNGRVFGTALGHDVNAMKSPGFIITLQRGAEWAATGKVTIPVPNTMASNR